MQKLFTGFSLKVYIIYFTVKTETMVYVICSNYTLNIYFSIIMTCRNGGISIHVKKLKSRLKKHLVNISLVNSFHLVVVKLVVAAVGADSEDAWPA